MTSRTPVSFIQLGRQFAAFEDEFVEIFRRIGRSGHYVMGPELAGFEAEFAAYVQTRHALGVANATDGLALALKALGVGPGDEVITAANSFIASAGAIVEVGAVPVFADIRDDLNIDPASIERKITARTRALMPVHLTGRPADMDAINAIAAKHGLRVVEDAAQSVGATYKGRRTGGLGDIGVFSLHPLKNLHLYGDGGVITTNDPELHQRIARLRNHGLIDRDTCAEWGRNSRLDELQAAIGRVKLRHIEAFNQRFREIAGFYRDRLGAVLTIPAERPYEHNVHHNFVVLTERREQLSAFLAERGIDTKVRYPRLLNQQPAFTAAGGGCDTPVAAALNTRILSLPIYPEITGAELQVVTDAILAFFTQT